eukprot:gene7943-5716_t
MADIGRSFEDIKTALLGTTILPQPRVSRDTIISVLQTHTDLIFGLKKENKAIQLHVNEVERETKENKKQLHALETDMAEMRKDIDTLFRQNEEFRKEVEELSVKVAELYVLKRMMADQQQFVETLSNKFNQFSTEVTEYMDNNNKNIATMQDTCDKTVFQLKEMKDYVDHFADNLVLNSQQITVDTYAGFSSKPITLTEVLRMCNGQFVDITGINSRQDEQITKLFADLDTKAPDTIVFNVATLEKKVGTIELHIQKEEEQGIGALRKICEQLSVQMQAVNAEMADKIDRESVGFIVHEKYEEIVRYLHEALQSSLEDEKNFKEKADEIQEMVILLSNSKADRTEIANMQEVMVKSEALLKKVGAQANLKEKIKDFVSRKEMEQLLSMKVDKLEFEQQLQSAVTNSRRVRKMATLDNGLPPVVDGVISGGNHLDMKSSYGTDDHGRQSMVGGSGRAQSPTMLSSSSQKAGGPVQILRGNIAAAQHGSLSAGGSLVGGQVSQMGGGYSMAGGNGGRSSADFSAFMKGKGKGKDLLSTSLPSAEVPGAFRKASEGGRPGGQVKRPTSGKSPAGYGASEYPYTDPNYQNNYADQGALTDHLAYLQGPIVGGGFNVRAAHLQKATPSGSVVAQEDIEGKGMMMQGADGHMYYQDLSAGGHK